MKIRAALLDGVVIVPIWTAIVLVHWVRVTDARRAPIQAERVQPACQLLRPQRMLLARRAHHLGDGDGGALDAARRVPPERGHEECVSGSQAHCETSRAREEWPAQRNGCCARAVVHARVLRVWVVPTSRVHALSLGGSVQRDVLDTNNLV
eukprot:CAMPEP_0119411090 /NCGR_PEP_ID=MMETSP1335-20130426/3929_1 /TAXON_ID=259385 /ORGANISM="Chrysoculter rhomboideus, Strain RCC1486" /LENGTH=150 /DNA_ID=CAMNT_0007435699 /DNA_START=138 /DNA_END=591 /DNA_ORIENTATION=+